MINFLHSFNPQPILLSFGALHIYWYGLFMVTGISAALFVTIKLAKHYKILSETIIDLGFWLIIFGLIGARIYDCFLNFNYYLQNPLDVLKIWQGGLAIHGGLIAGLIAFFIFIKKYAKLNSLDFKIEFWKFAAIIVPSIALGQAIGRWGNYFNQEIFGLPTNLPWGIPINLVNRPLEYISSNFFHPTFLYESLGSLLIFLILLGAQIYIIKKNKPNYKNYVIITCGYFILYSILRFSLEFIRIDAAPNIAGWRWPQIISLLIICISGTILIKTTLYEKIRPTKNN